MINLNIGEKVSLYKEKLEFKNYQDFARVVGVNGSWLLDLSKKNDISYIDINNLLKLCEYLGVTVDSFIKDDIVDSEKSKDIGSISNNLGGYDDIGILIDELNVLLEKDSVKLNGLLMNEKSKRICKDSLSVVKTLSRQYL